MRSEQCAGILQYGSNSLMESCPYWRTEIMHPLGLQEIRQRGTMEENG